MELFKTTPYEHQIEALRRSRGRREFALLLEQGLGKTKVILDEAAILHRRGRIDGLLVVAPNGVHSNWIRREVPAHCPDDVRCLALEWSVTRHPTKKFQRAFTALRGHDGLAILAMNVEAFSQGSKALELARRFLGWRTAMMVVDESSRIKTPRAARTKRVISLGRRAELRRILTGTPVTQSPFDIYAQFAFLDYDILGFTSFFAFKHHFGVFEKKTTKQGDKEWSYDELVRYVRLDELSDRVAPFSFRRTKDECLDLPPKIYKRIPVELTREQRRLYDKILEDGVVEIPDEGFEMLAPEAIVRILRCQQVTGGFTPTIRSLNDANLVGAGVAVPGRNPKLETLVSVLEDHEEKAIIWARFRWEIALIAKILRERFSNERRAPKDWVDPVVELHGGVTGEARVEAVDRFQDDPSCWFLVGNQASGLGITLTAAETVVYYSNSFSYEQRYQSEDRCHRVGLRHPVVYVDLEATDTVDERIRDVLKRARGHADLITRDSERTGRSLPRREDQEDLETFDRERTAEMQTIGLFGEKIE